MIAHFYIRFSTTYGQTLAVSGSHTALGDDSIHQAISLEYYNDQFWYGTVDLGDFGKKSLDIQYRYILKEADGNTVVEWGDDRIIE
ncbi:MAG: carbohydrate-binding module family 20 domain-containing protein, partial [Ferruginibacter sp.]